MKKTRAVIIAVVGVSLATAIGVSIKSFFQDKETLQIQSELFPVMEGTGCKPKFVINSEMALTLYCENVEAEREMIRQAALEKLKSWAQSSVYKDRHQQVSFEDEVVYSPKK